MVKLVERSPTMKIFGNTKQLKQIARRRAERAFVVAKIRSECGQENSARALAKIAFTEFIKVGEPFTALAIARRNDFREEIKEAELAFAIDQFGYSSDGSTFSQLHAQGVSAQIIQNAFAIVRARELIASMEYDKAIEYARTLGDSALVKEAQKREVGRLIEDLFLDAADQCIRGFGFSAQEVQKLLLEEKILARISAQSSPYMTAQVAKRYGFSEIMKSSGKKVLASRIAFVDGLESATKFVSVAREFDLESELPHHTKEILTNLVGLEKRETIEKIAEVLGSSSAQVMEIAREQFNTELEKGNYLLAQSLAKEYGFVEEEKILGQFVPLLDL